MHDRGRCCPVCGEPDQMCTNPDADPGPIVAPQEEPTARPRQSGTLAVYTLPDGSTRKLTAADAEALGLT